MCESDGLPIEYCEPWIGRTEFLAVLWKENQNPSSCVFVCVKGPCLVLKMRRVKLKREIQALPSNVGFFARLNSTGLKNSETCT